MGDKALVGVRMGQEHGGSIMVLDKKDLDSHAPASAPVGCRGSSSLRTIGAHQHCPQPNEGPVLQELGQCTRLLLSLLLHPNQPGDQALHIVCLSHVLCMSR